jgi:hypothetical protein
LTEVTIKRLGPLRRSNPVSRRRSHAHAEGLYVEIEDRSKHIQMEHATTLNKENSLDVGIWMSRSPLVMRNGTNNSALQLVSEPGDRAHQPPETRSLPTCRTRLGTGLR